MLYDINTICSGKRINEDLKAPWIVHGKEFPATIMSKNPVEVMFHPKSDGSNRINVVVDSRAVHGGTASVKITRLMDAFENGLINAQEKCSASWLGK